MVLSNITQFRPNFSGTIIVNDPVINAANFTVNEWLLTSKPGLFGLIGGWANPTGAALMVILTVMFFCSQAFVRRSGFFEVSVINFYISLLTIQNDSKVNQFYTSRYFTTPT